LRKPVPLKRALHVAHGASGGLHLMDGSTIVADADAAQLALEIPAPPTRAQAEQATAKYPGHQSHAFPGCFVCGPQHTEGLRIFPGVASEGTRVLAPWTPDKSLAGDDGVVRPEFLWAALDCPGYWAAMIGESPRPALLGQMTVRLEAPVRIGEPRIIVGWPLVRSGRKHRVGTALFTATGELRGVALAIWIEPSPAP